MPSKSLAYKDLERHHDRQQEDSAHKAEEASRVAQAADAEQASRAEQAAQAERASRASQVSPAEQAARAEDARQEELAELAMLTLMAALERTPPQLAG